MTFLEQFFGAGNAIQWQAFKSGTLGGEAIKRLRPFVNELQQNPDVGALPRVTPQHSLHWYILCRSARDQRLLREELRAFLGLSYSSFDGQADELNPADPVDMAVLEHWGPHSFRVDLPSSDAAARERTRERLLVWLRMRRERPARVGPRVRATGRILRDFEYAISNADGVAALACIEELRSFGRLDARNLRFLEVRRLGSLGLWRELRALPEFDSLLAIRRPVRVTESIIASIYVTEIEPFEQSGNVAGALTHFRDEIRPRFGELYRSRRGLNAEEATASFVLAAATDDPPRPDAVSAILDGFAGTPARRKWLEAVASTIAQAPGPKAGVSEARTPSIENARTAFATGDLDLAIELALSVPASSEQAGLLLRCAYEVGTMELAHTALDAYSQLTPAEQQQIRNQPRLGRIHAELTELLGTASTSEAASEPVIDSWLSWLRRLSGGPHWPAAVAAAELGAREWPVASLIDPSNAAELTKLIAGSRPTWADEALRDASPYLIEALLRDSSGSSSLQPVYEALLLVLLTDPTPSLPAFQVLTRLVHARLALAITAADYRELLDGLGDVMDQLSSPAVCEAALEALEALVSVPSAERRALEGFVARVVRIFARWHRRVDALQRKLLADIAGELGVPEMVALPVSATHEPESDPLYASLERLRIGLYSLNERALTRAARILNHVCPGASVDIFNDHVGGSPALRAAAATADVFVVAVASAKHAATGYIAQNRPKGRLTFYARGQGSTGLLAALRENSDAIKRATTRH